MPLKTCSSLSKDFMKGQDSGQTSKMLTLRTNKYKLEAKNYEVGWGMAQ
jgi:hypothetical protein